MAHGFRGFPVLVVLGSLALASTAAAQDVSARRALAPVQTVKSVQKDGIRDGAIKGALIGGLATGVPAAVFFANSGACPCKDNDAAVMKSAAIGAGIGAGVGVLIDSLMYRRNVSAGPPVALAPAVAPGYVGLAGRFRW